MTRNRSKPLLFLPIETKVREYHAKLLFSLFAVEKGFSVVLGGQRSLRNLVHKFDRGIYIDKSVASTKKKWVKWCDRMGHVLVAWDEEGLVYFSDTVYHELRLSEEVLKHMKLFFTWGHAQADTILNKLPEQKNLVISGNPRFDLLKPGLRNFYLPEAKELNEKYGSILLINTNFGLGNHYHGAETERQRLRTYPIDSERPDFFDGWIDMQQKTCDYFVKMIPELREQFPDHTIIVRPHPSENHSIWEQAIAGLDRCFVTGERNVLEWILASDLLIHTNCTTAIEAFLLGVRSILYHPYPLGEYEQKLPNAVSLEATTLEQLIGMMSDVLSGQIDKSVDRQKAEFARYYLENYSDTLASETILSSLQNHQLIDHKQRNVKQKFGVTLRSLWLVAQKMKNLAGKHSPYDTKKFPGLTMDELEQDVKKFENVTGNRFNVKIRNLGNDCFFLTKQATV